jgi:hypothetical protein
MNKGESLINYIKDNSVSISRFNRSGFQPCCAKTGASTWAMTLL